MSYTIEQIEDALIDKLDALKDTQGVRTLKTYQGELETEDDVAKMVRLFPAVFVVYGGSDYADHGARKVQKMRFVIIVCDKSLRAEEEARRGGVNNPGTYALLGAVRDLLYGSMLDLEIYPVSLLREESAWFSKGVSIYAAEYETAQALLYPGD